MYCVCMGIELHWKDESFHIKHFVNVFRMRFRFVIYNNRYVEGLAIKIWYVNCTEANGNWLTATELIIIVM
jgi:hypothetical protein